MLYFTEIDGHPVSDSEGHQIGKLHDLIFLPRLDAPPLHAALLGGSTPRAIPAACIARLDDEDGIHLTCRAAEIPEITFSGTELSVRHHLLDKQAVHVPAGKLIRVNDVGLERGEPGYVLAGIDRGHGALARRLGVRRFWPRLGQPAPNDLIPWAEIDPVARPKLRDESISSLHPADLGRLLDELSPAEASGLLASLDDETAAEALEETSPERQATLLQEIGGERAADILENMSPDEAADVLGDLPAAQAEQLLNLMERDESDEVKELLSYAEDTAGGLMTTELVALPHDMTAAQAIDRLREVAEEIDTIYYIYVVESPTSEKLVGVTTLRALLLAAPETRLSELLAANIKTVSPEADTGEVARTLARYNLLAVPVVDGAGNLQGIVTVDDALDAVLPAAWRKKT